jgi:hypothetical protein
MSTSHTPGPWFFDAVTGRVVDAKGNVLAFAAAAHESSLSNGPLIAAAPELLDALAEATGALKACSEQLAAEFPKTSLSLAKKADEFMALLVKATKP